MEDKINTLKKMIEEAKLENDEVLVDYLTKSVEHLLEKQKTQEGIKSQENINQEENTIKEVKQEEKKDEKYEIEEIVTNGISTLTIFKTGNRRLESPYINVEVQSSNSKLNLNLSSLLITLALDDARRKNNFIKDYKQILTTAQTEQDVKDMLAFLQVISSVGELGAKYSILLTPETQKRMQEITKKPEEQNNDISNNLEEIYKQIELLDMEYDRIKNGNKGIDPEDLYAIAKKYESQIEDLEDLYKNEIDKEKQIELEFKIDELRKKAKDIGAYASQIEELANFSFGL